MTIDAFLASDFAHALRFEISGEAFAYHAAELGREVAGDLAELERWLATVEDSADLDYTDFCDRVHAD
jgi:hypothetical protein